MKKIKLKQIVFLVLCIIIGVFLLSSIFIMDASGDKSSLGLIQWDETFQLIFIPLVFIVGVVCGALAIYLTKISKGIYIFLTSLFTGIITLFFYAIVTLLANWEYVFSPRVQHYAWSETMGYIGDAMFIFFVVLFAYGIFILPGFIVGGAIPLFIKKIKTSKENQI